MRSVRISSLSGILAGIVSLCRPSSAAAHLITTGMGPVYDGIGHLLLTPEDLVPVLPLAWFVGGVAGSMINTISPFPLPAVSFLVLGGLVAADLRMPADAVSILMIVIGLLHGFFNGTALKEGAETLGLLGIMIMLFVLVALASAFVVSLKKPWTRIAVRVAGSWIFASGLLMVGWFIREAMRIP